MTARGYEFSFPLFALGYDEIYTPRVTDAQEAAGGTMAGSIQLAPARIPSCVICNYCCGTLIYDGHRTMRAGLMSAQR